jgi:serine/threonine-protein kinase HipA
MRLDLRESVDNEWLCAALLEAYGLPVARCHPLVFEGQRVLAVERFDRQWSADGRWLLRLPQEDFCQATGTPAHARYEADGGPGIDRILTLLNGSRHRAADRETFLRAQLLFWLLCAPDGHAKNFSLALQAGGTFALTPLYDVMSAYPLLGEGPDRISPHRVRLAMALRAQNAHWRVREIQLRHWQEVGRRNGVVSDSGHTVDDLVDDIVARTPAVLATVQARLPAGFAPRVAETILEGLQGAVARLQAMRGGT